MVVVVCQKDFWDFQAKSGSSGRCPLFIHALGKLAVQKCLGERLEVPDVLLSDIRDQLSPAQTLRGWVCQPRFFFDISKVPNMTGRPGCRTMEMNRGSSAPYLARTPRGGDRRVFRLPGEGGDHFHCAVEPSPGHIRCRISEVPKMSHFPSEPLRVFQSSGSYPRATDKPYFLRLRRSSASPKVSHKRCSH